MLQALASTPKDLALMIKGMADAAIWQRPAPDQWAIINVINHLVYVERRYLKRLRQVLETERPSLPVIMPDETKHHTQVTLSELIACFEETRGETVLFLKEVAPDCWQRTAVHETRGDVTFRFLVQFLVEHDINHLNQIAEIQQQLHTSPKPNTQPVIHKPTQEESFISPGNLVNCPQIEVHNGRRD